MVGRGGMHSSMYDAVGQSPDQVLSVSSFLDWVNRAFKQTRVTIQGEVTSVTIRQKTVYFALGDPDAPPGQAAKLECLIWRSVYERLGIKLEEGLEVQVVGGPNIYKPFGKFSLMVERLSPVGEGALQQAFEALKRQLNQEGLFAADRKRSLPPYLEKIGLITSRQGDAKQDFLTHLGEYGLQIRLLDARVEGLQAIDTLVRAVKWFNAQPEPVDVLVLTRGGGSLESLQAFNSEDLARVIAESRIPVVSAVGHENDVTIADLVADQRASTPTAAGRLLTQDWQLAGHELRQAAGSLPLVYQRQLDRQRARLGQWVQALTSFLAGQLAQAKQVFWQFQEAFGSWRATARRQREQLGYRANQVVQRFEFQFKTQQQTLEHRHKLLLAADPTRLLSQGYSIVRNQQGQILRSIQQLKPDQQVNLQLQDGQASAQIERIST